MAAMASSYTASQISRLHTAGWLQSCETFFAKLCWTNLEQEKSHLCPRTLLLTHDWCGYKCAGCEYIVQREHFREKLSALAEALLPNEGNPIPQSISDGELDGDLYFMWWDDNRTCYEWPTSLPPTSPRALAILNQACLHPATC